MIFYTHAHGWYLSVRSPVYWRWPWRYRLRMGWDRRRKLGYRLAGYLEVRRTRPWRWKPRRTFWERYAGALVWLEDEFVLTRVWRGVRGALAYRGGLRRRRVFAYYLRR